MNTRAALTTSIAILGLLFISENASAQTPEQRYWEWASLDFAPAEYQSRRARLMEELRRIGDGVLLVPGAQGTSHGPSFRQLDNFHYWTGLELPWSMLILDAAAGTAVIYAPARDARFENPGRANDFPGRPLADDETIADQVGIEIRDARTLETELEKLAATRTLYIDLGSGGGDTEGGTGRYPDLRPGMWPDLSPEQLLVMHLRSTLSDVRIENAFRAIARVRAIKSAAEIDIIRRLAQLTESAIAQAAAHIVEGIDERSLEGWFELGCKQGGSQRSPFHPIVKSGPNALWPWRVLASHYDRRNRKVQNGDLIIFDVGCELNHYVSDVGRTFPVSGSFTAEQTAALDMQRRVSAAIIAAIRPGITLADVQRAADVAIPPHERRYMQTGSYFSHHLGLSTGDPVLTEEPLQAGMIFTVEPWYYNHDTGISVFVEDMILVTEDGAEILTSSLPRSAEELSAMVGTAGGS